MKLLIFYALGVYLIFIAAGTHLNNAHGGGLKAQTNGFPTIRSTESSREYPPAKNCREYLGTCEKSCKDRGDYFRFACLGQSFNPEIDRRYTCQCFDDVIEQVTKREPKI
jgi:hypothetical protein